MSEKKFNGSNVILFMLRKWSYNWYYNQMVFTSTVEGINITTGKLS